MQTVTKSSLQLQLCLLRKSLTNIYFLSVFVYLLSLFTLNSLCSPTPLQCRTRSAKQFHAKQWKIFGYCFLDCRPTALSEAHKQLRPREATYSAVTFYLLTRINKDLFQTFHGCHKKKKNFRESYFFGCQFVRESVIPGVIKLRD